jgi:hypothetical protein
MLKIVRKEFSGMYLKLLQTFLALSVSCLSLLRRL